MQVDEPGHERCEAEIAHGLVGMGCAQVLEVPNLDDLVTIDENGAVLDVRGRHG